MDATTVTAFDAACQAGHEAALLVLAGRVPDHLGGLDDTAHRWATAYLVGYLAEHLAGHADTCRSCTDRLAGAAGRQA